MSCIFFTPELDSSADRHPLFAPRKTPSAGGDAELLLAKDAEPELPQIRKVNPGVGSSSKKNTKKHPQR